MKVKHSQILNSHYLMSICAPYVIGICNAARPRSAVISIASVAHPPGVDGIPQSNPCLPRPRPPPRVLSTPAARNTTTSLQRNNAPRMVLPRGGEGGRGRRRATAAPAAAKADSACARRERARKQRRPRSGRGRSLSTLSPLPTARSGHRERPREEEEGQTD